MITKDKFEVVEKNGHFIVTKNGSPIVKETKNLITEFNDRKDAEKYVSILNMIKRQS